MHLWLDPDNARAIAAEAAKVLSEKDPANAEAYKANLAALTEKLDAHRLVMRGTYAPPIRCVALDADIGKYSRCSIHPNRPSVCRDVDASFEYGLASEQCDRARIAHGLPVITAADWRWRDAPDNDGQPDDNGNSPSPPRLPPLAA